MERAGADDESFGEDGDVVCLCRLLVTRCLLEEIVAPCFARRRSLLLRVNRQSSVRRCAAGRGAWCRLRDGQDCDDELAARRERSRPLGGLAASFYADKVYGVFPVPVQVPVGTVVDPTTSSSGRAQDGLPEREDRGWASRRHRRATGASQVLHPKLQS